ncbi:MAG: radical SAM protein [Candidatus Woesearchaeota archaeon]|nr:radical SAM protein [Candidatus Woesearchaeota archaeon]
MEAELEKFRNEAGFYLSRLVGKILVPPENVYLEITAKCNLRCRMCNLWRQDIKGELSKEQCFRIIGDMSELRIPHLIISGGEPFLRDFVIDISNYAKKKWIRHVSVISNGTLINEKTAEEIANSGIDHITISIDGLMKNNDYVRGKGSFKKGVNAINLITKYSRKIRNGGLTAGINCVVQNRNLEELPDMARLAKRLGCNIIVFQPMLSDNLSMHKRLTRDELWVPRERIPILEQSINELLRMKKDKAYSDLIFVEPIVLKLIKDYYAGTMKHQNIKCYDGYIRIVINSRGSLWMCDSNYGESTEHSLKELFTSACANKLRKGIKKCAKPCLQACVLKPELESLEKISKRFASSIPRGKSKNAFYALKILGNYEKTIKSKCDLSPIEKCLAFFGKGSTNPAYALSEIRNAKRIIRKFRGDVLNV